MDPLSHVSVGRSLVAAYLAFPGAPRADRLVRGAVAAGVLGTLAPDLDAVFMPFGWDLYLRAHEIGTHAIIGNAGCALLTAALVRLFARTTSYAVLFTCASIGTISHVLLDLLSSARLRPFWPVVDTVISLPTVAMADPWLIGLCVAGPVSLWIWRSNPAKTAGIAITAILIFLLAKSVAGVAAFAAYRAARDAAAAPVEARVIEAKWASLSTWHVFDRTPQRLRTWRATVRGSAVEVLSWPLERESEPIRTSRSFSTVRNFLRVHQLGFAAVVPAGEGGSLVLWSDIRFCWNPTRPNAPVLEPIVRTEDGRQRIACALWFGGELDADGHPIREIVKVGGLTQGRALAR